MAGRRAKKANKGAAPRTPPAAPGPPLPSLPALSSLELCSLTGLTDRRHRQLAEQGYFRPPIRGIYGPDAIPGLFKYFIQQLRKKNEALAREQLQLTKAKRETAEEELSVLRGEYVKKAEIGPALRNISLHQRATLQRKLEQELASVLSDLTPVQVLERLRLAVDEICAVFRDGIAQWCDAPPATPAPLVPAVPAVAAVPTPET